MHARPFAFTLALLAGCGAAAHPTAQPDIAARLAIPPKANPEEPHLGDLTQLTSHGENAEAYWSFGGDQLILQSRRGGEINDCDRIYRMPLAQTLATPAQPLASPALVPVSSGKGATTCSYFLPGDREVIYASTHLGGDACPPRPDHSQGYVWALYDSYDIFRANADGSNPMRLTSSPGYDAEGTVCAKDGSIIFTSTRDGDLELYRMDNNGKDVQRLTHTPGYDGGAFFNADCTKIVWRASRPQPGPELEDYQRLLAQNLVRPTKLELWVANADGSDAQQITYLNAAAFAPFWHPSQQRILFSSNYGDPRGREFDIWAINTDGSGLERITHTPGFDGFPMFSPDGRWLAFSSNRATAQGANDTNVFLARWIDAPQPAADNPADRVRRDVAWLSDPAREGRGIGQQGLEASGAYIEARFRDLGLTPAGTDGSFREPFPVVTRIDRDAATQVAFDGQALGADEFVVMGYSPAQADVDAQLAFAGYGVVARPLDIDDYAKLDVRGKVVVVRRFVPEGGKFTGTDVQRRYGDIRQKAFAARERGARALIVVDDPQAPERAEASWTAPAEARLPALEPEGYADAGLPVIVIKRNIGHALIERLAKRERVRAALHIRLTPVTTQAFNVAALIPATPADGNKLPGTVIVGAHYDHLGLGGRNSLSPHLQTPHVGADDNASGTAALLEVARTLRARKNDLRRDVLLIAFSGEESGLLGSGHHVAERTQHGKTKLRDAVAMLNMDMVGRMRDNRLQVLGAETSPEWGAMVQTACDAAGIDCALSGDGYGPSDQLSFYTAGVPVLHFFTGTHSDYHKPSDTADKVNAGGAAQTGAICAAVALAVSGAKSPPGYKAAAHSPGPQGDLRSFNASLGTLPDYAGPGPGKKGVLLAGVRPGSAAEKAGMRKGDVLIRLGKSEIGSVEDFMFVLNASRPGETVPAVVVRNGKPTQLQVTFQESQRGR